jgi:DNA-binding GntR family transcriptional regulator
LREKAYSQIRAMILNFELKPGYKIIASEIASDIKLGRTPVREALAMLEKEQLLIRDHRSGYRITQLKEREVGDYFRIRILLEEYGAGLVVERATNSDLKKMQDQLTKAREIQRTGDMKKIIQSDAEFHEQIYKATKSEIFYQTISRLNDKTSILRSIALHSEWGKSHWLKDHLQILRALKNRDVKSLVRIIRTHVKYAHAYYLSRPNLF